MAGAVIVANGVTASHIVRSPRDISAFICVEANKSMAKVEIYTNPMCGYCYRAKKLLSAKGVDFVEYDLWAERGKHAEMLRRSDGRHTVPQIFIDDRGIGGSDELAALDASGELAALLRGESAAA